MSLYVPHWMEALHSSLFSPVGVHIPLFFPSFFFFQRTSADNFPLT